MRFRGDGEGVGKDTWFPCAPDVEREFLTAFVFRRVFA